MMGNVEDGDFIGVGKCGERGEEAGSSRCCLGMWGNLIQMIWKTLNSLDTLVERDKISYKLKGGGNPFLFTQH